MIAERASGSSERIAAPLAPRWHTAALIALQLAVALTGTWLMRQGSPPAAARAASAPPVSRVFSQYLPLLVVNWSLVLYCVRLFRGHNALPALLGFRARSARGLSADLALAISAGVVIFALNAISASVFTVGRNAAIAALLPSTGAERLTWALVAVSVGFCEEVVYRGYLQTQLAAFMRSRPLGIALQAALFGLAHLEQGPAVALRVAVYGVVLGVLASVRRSLLPGILCHVGIDLASGLLR